MSSTPDPVFDQDFWARMTSPDPDVEPDPIHDLTAVMRTIINEVAEGTEFELHRWVLVVDTEDRDGVFRPLVLVRDPGDGPANIGLLSLGDEIVRRRVWNSG